MAVPSVFQRACSWVFWAGQDQTIVWIQNYFQQKDRIYWESSFEGTHLTWTNIGAFWSVRKMIVVNSQIIVWWSRNSESCHRPLWFVSYSVWQIFDPLNSSHQCNMFLTTKVPEASHTIMAQVPCKLHIFQRGDEFCEKKSHVFHLKKRKTSKSRNSCRMSGGGVGVKGMAKRCTKPHGPGNNTKRSHIALSVTSITLSLERFGTQLLGLPAQSLTDLWSSQLVTGNASGGWLQNPYILYCKDSREETPGSSWAPQHQENKV